jgi:hypothetical protein
MNIHVHIDRLVLDGLPLAPADGQRVQAAFEAELGRLLAAEGPRSHLRVGGMVPSLPAGDLRLAHQSDPASLGHQLAGAVYEGIGQ